MTCYKITGENRSVFGDETFSREVRTTNIKMQRAIKEGTAIIPEMPYRFRCCDDDGITYFWGICNKDDSFIPLDLEGMDYGCTYIEYKNPATGKYEIL